MEDVVLPSYSAVSTNTSTASNYKEQTVLLLTSTKGVEDALKGFVASITDDSVKDVS